MSSIPANQDDDMQSRMTRLLRPRSIAIVGASDKPGSLGEAVLSNLERAAFPGEIHLINPRRERIGNRACFPSADALPENTDCAVLAIPGAAVIGTLEACARRRVASAIVFSAGFAESGETGHSAQQHIAQLARSSNLLIEGPNCLGLVNYVHRIPLTFIRTACDSAINSQGAAILSQSGALAAVLGVNLLHHAVPVSYSITTGNEAVCGVEHFIEHLLEDEHTRVFTMIVEQFRQPRRFLELAARARTLGKFLVLLHSGRSAAARVSAATHTGALTGDYDLMSAKVKDAGVVLVETLEELVDVTQMLVRCAALPRGGAAIFAESGAFKAHALDLCDRISLELPSLSPAAHDALRNELPAFIAPSNPMDLTAHALIDPDLYRRTIPHVLGDAQFGSVLLAIILTDRATSDLKFPPILDALRNRTIAKPVIFAALDEGAPAPAEHIAELHRLGVPFFPSPERALRAMACATAAAKEPKRAGAPPVPRLGLSSDSGIVPEYRAKALLAQCGIPIPRSALAHTLDEAQYIASEIGFPVALKAQSRELSHKSDAGGVELNVADANHLAEAWERMHHNLAESSPAAALDGVLIERMASRGIELICGARSDPDWGPILLIGFGGVLAEARQDVALLVPGLSVDAIAIEFHKLRGSPLLRGFRGSPPVDVNAAATIVQRLGAILTAHPEIREIDLNPVIASPRGALAVDALMVVDPKPSPAYSSIGSPT